jgi:hypothetical protein
MIYGSLTMTIVYHVDHGLSYGWSIYLAFTFYHQDKNYDSQKNYDDQIFLLPFNLCSNIFIVL